MKTNLKIIARALYLATKDKKPKEIDQITDNFFSWLRQHRLFSKRSVILSLLADVHRQEEKTVLVRVSSRTALSESQRHEIKKKLEHELKKKVELGEDLDQMILGGYRIYYGDTVYDATLNKQLINLQRHLLQP